MYVFKFRTRIVGRVFTVLRTRADEHMHVYMVYLL